MTITLPKRPDISKQDKVISLFVVMQEDGLHIKQDSHQLNLDEESTTMEEDQMSSANKMLFKLIFLLLKTFPSQLLLLL